MNIALLILVSIIVLGIPLSFLLLPRSKFPRILAALALVGVDLFCVFGFLASYEYSEPSKRLPWQIGYGVLGMVSLIGVAVLLRRRRRSSTPSSTEVSH